MGFEACFGFEIISDQDHKVDHILCAECRERVYDREVDEMPSLKELVNFMVAHLGMFHPENIPPQARAGN
jgi:hypothetical protein